MRFWYDVFLRLRLPGPARENGAPRGPIRPIADLEAGQGPGPALLDERRDFVRLGIVQELFDVLLADRACPQTLLQTLHEQRESEYADGDQQHKENHDPPVIRYLAHYRVAP